MDCIIPTYQPDERFIRLIDSLLTQKQPVERIIIMNTEEAEWVAFLDRTGFVAPECMEVHHVTRKEFNHATTRTSGIKLSDSDYFLLMTQDAVPVDADFTSNLMQAVKQDNVATAYARQIAYPGTSLPEQLNRKFNYPEDSVVKSERDLPVLGIKTYFCSNVSCLYNRAVWDKLGGFVDKADFNEDMLYAAKVIRNGYSIAYCAEALVYHSHDYTGREQFRRNIEIGRNQAMHPEVFEGVSSTGEGKKLVITTTKQLLKRGQVFTWIHFMYLCVCRYAGFIVGKKSVHK